MECTPARFGRSPVEKPYAASHTGLWCALGTAARAGKTSARNVARGTQDWNERNETERTSIPPQRRSLHVAFTNSTSLHKFLLLVQRNNTHEREGPIIHTQQRHSSIRSGCRVGEESGQQASVDFRRVLNKKKHQLHQRAGKRVRTTTSISMLKQQFANSRSVLFAVVNTPCTTTHKNTTTLRLSVSKLTSL